MSIVGPKYLELPQKCDELGLLFARASLTVQATDPE